MQYISIYVHIYRYIYKYMFTYIFRIMSMYIYIYRYRHKLNLHMLHLIAPWLVLISAGNLMRCTLFLACIVKCNNFNNIRKQVWAVATWRNTKFFHVEFTEFFKYFICISDIQQIWIYMGGYPHEMHDILDLFTIIQCP